MEQKKRLYLLDTIRGMAILGMFLIHINYDLPTMLGIDPEYTYSFGYYVFGQLVRGTFIFLSGYCAFMGKKTLKRGLIVSAAGLVITASTVLAGIMTKGGFIPIYFGVLTLIGASMLLSVPFRKIVNKKNAPVFFFTCLLCFFLTIHMYAGYAGIYGHPLFYYPDFLYKAKNPVLAMVMAFIGFPNATFQSSDYFPLMPWFFLFMSGFSLYGWIGEKINSLKIMKIRIEPVTFLGRYSLWVYLIHQPVFLGILWIISLFIKN
ncbi:MAG: DUF1624 domain-containing protein [Lachnospiraceae bacterium]|nr:DUF1624 domain-containing protein [Lachnospiraceae bacterium]